MLANSDARLTELHAGGGDIQVTATTGAISNNSGANSPAILIGNQATLTAQTGIGSGVSSDTTAIGTDLTSLIATVSGIGDVVIFEQSGLNLGAINITSGSLDVSADLTIQQEVGNPVLNVTDALFTTRSSSIGSVDVLNGGSLILDASRVAGNFSIDVGGNTLTLNGNSEVGLDYNVTATTYNENGFIVDVAGTPTTPPTTPLNTVTANGTSIFFNLSSATLATTGDITVNLRGGYYQANNTQANDAILINSTNNNITGSLTVTTVDPDLVFINQDYHLVNNAAISLAPAQRLIINAAKGLNFTPGIVSPNSSPFSGSLLNSGNGSDVTLLNFGGGNTFQDWVSIRDAYDTRLEASSDITTQYINTYGNLTINSSAGALATGAQSQTVRCAGANLRMNSQGNITLTGSVSNLSIPGALNGVLSYNSTAGSVSGAALSQASQTKVNIPGGAIGTDLTTLIATVTGGGNIVIFEQNGLDLGAINAVGGTLDISAGNLIRQIPGDPQLNVANAHLSTRDTTIGTVDVFNTGHLVLNASRAAGDLTVNVGVNTLTLGGNSEVGVNYTITAGTYNENGFTVNFGGTSVTPPPLGGFNTISANGASTSFDLSSATLASTGDITVNLRGGYYQAGTPQISDAILLSSTNNNITNSLTVTTTDPNLSFVAQDYDLMNSGQIALNAGQKLIINAAKGLNFTPGISNPNSSPYDSSSLNGNNGSNITLTNIGPDNVFQDWVSIRDPYNTTFEAGSNLLVEYVNTYGDLEITTTSGTMTTGANSQTVRAAGSSLKMTAQNTINVNGSVSNLTVPGALNGTVSYHSLNGSVAGNALSQANGIKVETPNGGIGTGGARS